MSPQIRKAIKAFVIIALSVVGIVYLYFFVLFPPHFTVFQNAHDVADLVRLKKISEIVFTIYSNTGKFPESLESLKTDPTMIDNPVLSSFLAPPTLYCPPVSKDSDSRHILMARPTKHGMAILFLDGNGTFLKYKEPSEN